MHARSCAPSFSSCFVAVWGLLPLLVRQELRLGPQAFGVLLGCMGAGAVGAGFLLPALRGRLDRGQTVLAGSLLGAVAMAMLGLIHHWAAAAIAMLLYGVAWISAASTLQAAAQMARRPGCGRGRWASIR
jgi:hypothetical protein